MGDPPIGRGTPGEALALAPDCHDEFLQTNAVHTLCQVTVPIMAHKTSSCDIVCDQSHRKKEPHHKGGLSAGLNLQPSSLPCS